MNEPDTPPRKPASLPWRITLAAVAVLGRGLCKLGAPLLNLGWRLREWAAERLAD